MLPSWIIDSRAAWTEVDAPGAGQRQDRVRAADPGLTPGATDLAPACAGSVKQFLGGTGSRLPAPRPPGYRRISEEVEKPAGLEPARRVSVAPDPHRADLAAKGIGGRARKMKNSDGLGTRPRRRLHEITICVLISSTRSCCEATRSKRSSKIARGSSSDSLRRRPTSDRTADRSGKKERKWRLLPMTSKRS
jgi:hypothetical protein